MALSASDHDSRLYAEPSTEDITRWGNLFEYCHQDASWLIKKYRSNSLRLRIPDCYWSAIKKEKEAQGYDREAYEFELEYEIRFKLQVKGANEVKGSKKVKEVKKVKGGKRNGKVNDLRRGLEWDLIWGLEWETRRKYMLGLGRISNSLKKAREAAGLDKSPGTIEDQLSFIRDEATRSAILGLLRDKFFNKVTTMGLEAQRAEGINVAAKELDRYSAYPTLGLKPTLPAEDEKATFLPAQEEYPVYYFFYGTVADLLIVLRLLSTPGTERQVPKPASIMGGKLKTWGPYHVFRALVDGQNDDEVNGAAILVGSKEQEYILRMYETKKFEVVRCTILTDQGKQQQQGLTFRFVENDRVKRKERKKGRDIKSAG